MQMEKTDHLKTRKDHSAAPVARMCRQDPEYGEQHVSKLSTSQVRSKPGAIADYLTVLV